MNEFSLIETFFKSIPHARKDVLLGIGDDAACLQIPIGKNLLVSTDTLVSGVHFLDSWSAYDIAYRSVMVNVSDMAAMGAYPAWLSLALTLPVQDEAWLQSFSDGMRTALASYDMALVGGDTTRGPLSVTLTIHGLVEAGCAIRRGGAHVGDKIYVSGNLGAAAQAVALLGKPSVDAMDQALLMERLLRPFPRVDFIPLLQAFASAAIDISDGLSADLNHICLASGVGATLWPDCIPVHPLVKKYQADHALDFARCGGDDYELCFTVPALQEAAFLDALTHAGLTSFLIGVIDAEPGLRFQTHEGGIVPCDATGYTHF